MGKDIREDGERVIDDPRRGDDPLGLKIFVDAVKKQLKAETVESLSIRLREAGLDPWTLSYAIRKARK